ncbi:MAG: hypothetical protein ACK5L3_14755 [Oscillospiraceae bacterium]
MRYRNEQTGAEIETPCVISGGGWQPVISASDPPASDPPATKKATAKKTGGKSE